MKDLQILGCGAPLMDLLVEVDDAFLSKYVGEKAGMVHWDFAKQDEVLDKVDSKYSYSAAGSAGNTIKGLANLDVKSGFIGKIGRDKTGEDYLKHFQKLGVNTEYIFEAPVTNNGRCISFITPDSERTMRSFLGASLEICKDDISKVDFSRSSLVYLEGYLIYNSEVFYAVIENAIKANAKIALDLASFEVIKDFKDEWRKLFESGKISFVFGNEDEVASYFGNSDFEAALNYFSKYCEVAAIKLGTKGSLITHNQQIYQVDAKIVKAIDTTSAGDLWASGFLYGYINGMSIENSGNFASMTSAEVVQVIGTDIPVERWDYLKEEAKKLK